MFRVRNNSICVGVICAISYNLFLFLVNPSFAEPIIIFESKIKELPVKEILVVPPVEDESAAESTESEKLKPSEEAPGESSEPIKTEETTEESALPAKVEEGSSEDSKEESAGSLEPMESKETPVEASGSAEGETSEEISGKTTQAVNSETMEKTLEDPPASSGPEPSEPPAKVKTPQIEFQTPGDSPYHAFTLQDVIQMTIKNNVSIAVEEFRSKIKKEEVVEQRADFDPNLSMEFNIDDSNRQFASFFADPNVSDNRTTSWSAGIDQKLVTGTEYELKYEGAKDTTNSTFSGLNPQYGGDLTFSVTQPLLKNFGIDVNKTDIYIANNNLAISDYEFKDKVIEIISDAENIYWDLVFSIEDLKVKQKSVERAKDLERRVKAQVEVGTLAPLEILQAQSEVASREEFVLDSEKLIQDNDDKVKNIINLSFASPEGQKPIRPVDRPKFDIGPPIHLEESINTAIAQRPDYLQLKKELDSRNIMVKFNENQTYPSLDLVGSFNLNGISGNSSPPPPPFNDFHGDYGTAFDNMLDPTFRAWEVGVKLNYPLGNRAARSRLSASKLEASQMLLEIKNKEKDIIIEVREAVRKINTDIKRVQAARIARKLAEETLSAEEKKFEVGLSTSFNVLEFQTDLAEQQSKELKAVIDYNKSHINLRKVLASTLEENNIHLAAPTSQ